MRLLFILSLPRSGSTLLARMLLKHPSITSAAHAEPHLFVAAFGPLSGLGSVASWGADVTANTALDYLAMAPCGAKGYRRRQAAGIAQTYFSTATDPDADWFIDKTTRNALFAHDLVDALPDARFIILWRNPLDILASVYSTWCDNNWTWNANSVELFTGLETLVSLQRQENEHVINLRYEDLVADPRSILSLLSENLDIDDGLWGEERRDLSDVEFSGPHDPHARNAVNKRAHNNSLEKWRNSITTRRRRRMARKYLNWIGCERLKTMGYDLDSLLAELDSLVLPFFPSIFEDVQMMTLSAKRLGAVIAWHCLNEVKAFHRNALR